MSATATTPAAAPFRWNSDEQREHVMVRVSKLYYDLERTQGEIAEELGLTRWQIGRLLREAKETGVVRIQIVPHSPRLPDLESELQLAYGLKDAVIVPAPGHDEALVRESVAQAAAQYLGALHPKPKLLGISWGRTIASVAHWMRPNWNEDVQIVLLNGGTSRTSSPNRASHIADRLASTGNGTATMLPVPAILGNKTTRAALETEPVISEVLTLAQTAPIACFGLGALSTDSVLVESGYLHVNDITNLGRMGAVGDLLGRFVDAEGRIVDPDLNDRTIGLALNSLRQKTFSIGVASGSAKREVIRASLRAGYVNVLISDEQTARYLLKHRPA